MMNTFKRFSISLSVVLSMLSIPLATAAQDLPPRYLTLELFTNTPCPICGSQNPGLFNRLANFEGEYHLISFYPGKPYSTCVFYQANISENTTRYNHYTGEIFGSPTVALNGTDFKSSSGVTNTVLNDLTGGTSWLHVGVTETPDDTRTVTIDLEDVAGGTVTTGRLFAVIVEREVMYNAPNGETLHHNVFRRFLSAAAGEDIDLSSGNASREFQYTVDGSWNANETYVIAWLSNPDTKEIYNSGTRFDPDFISAVDPFESLSPLALYPNPAKDVVNLSLPSGVTSADIRIFNHQGQLVRSGQSRNETVHQINVNDLTSGHYVIKLITSHKVYSGAFEVVN